MSDSPHLHRIPRNAIPADGIHQFSFEASGWPVEGVIVQRGAILRAWVNRCAHLPLTLDMGSGEFFTAEGSELQCSHHGARYALDSGLCLWGPCKGRSLEPIPFDASDPEFLVLDLSAVDADRPPPPADYVDNS